LPGDGRRAFICNALCHKRGVYLGEEVGDGAARHAAHRCRFVPCTVGVQIAKHWQVLILSGSNLRFDELPKTFVRKLGFKLQSRPSEPPSKVNIDNEDFVPAGVEQDGVRGFGTNSFDLK
jgi:hypothetical protein